MKNKSDILYYIASISFFISATINYVNSGMAMGTIQIILGITFLCLGLEKSRDKKNQNKKK